MKEVLLCENKQWIKPLKLFIISIIVGAALTLCMFLFAFLPMVFSDMEDGDDYYDDYYGGYNDYYGSGYYGGYNDYYGGYNDYYGSGYYDDYYDDYYGDYNDYYDDYYDNYYGGGYYDRGVDFSDAWGYNDYFLPYCLIPFFFCIIVGGYYALIIKFTRLYVTNKRIYGKRIFGRRVDIPLSQISSVSRAFFFGKISIKTTSIFGITFNWIRNYKEMQRVICELLNGLQEHTDAIPGFVSEDTTEPSFPSSTYRFNTMSSNQGTDNSL